MATLECISRFQRFQSNIRNGFLGRGPGFSHSAPSALFIPAVRRALHMHQAKLSQRLVSLLVATFILVSPLALAAQQRRTAAPRKPAPVEPAEPPPTFDSLLAADSYKIYCEVRGAGGLIRSSAVNDLLEPFMKVGGPPKEFNTMVTWLNAHADVLAGSRVLIAGWASRPKLPNVLIAIEFPSAEEAKKFYPEFRDFLPKLLPTPTPTPSPTSGPAGAPMPAIVAPRNTAAVAEAQPAPTPPYQMKQTGTLVLLSDTTFNLSDLKPRGSKLLEEDQGFQLARNRFASESVFLYVDVKRIEKEEKDRQKKWEEEDQKRAEREAAQPKTEASPQAEESPESMETATTSPAAEEQASQPIEPEVVATLESPAVVGVDPQTSNDASLTGTPQRGTDEVSPFIFSLYGAFFGGQSRWPEAVAAAITFEGDAYVVRTLIINAPETKASAIPFVPQFVSGPALVPESPNIFPADTDLFVSASLDYGQVYEGMIKALSDAEELSKTYARRYSRGAVTDDPPRESPFAVYEKKLGLKIKDDILPLLGNELALALQRKPVSPAPAALPASAVNPVEQTTATDSEQKTAKPSEPTPLIAIAIKDREAVGRLIPKIIESLGFKGASLFAQTERRDGTELVSYGDVFVYAFVGDFLVVSADAAATRRVIDSYLDRQTLSSDSHFRNFTRWQPRQVLGQVYVAPGLVEQYNPIFGSRGNTRTSEFWSRLNPVIDPLTYALTNDGQGPLHEIHIPRNLLMLMIAGASSGAGEASAQTNEAIAKSMLQTVASAEATFHSTEGNGRYGTLDELASTGLVSKDYFQRFGYTIEVTVSGGGFGATATPIEYGKSGKLSYFIDESGVLRAGDHGGGAATIADQPME